MRVLLIVWYLVTITLVAALVSKYQEKEDNSWIYDHIFAYNEIDYANEKVYQFDLDVLELSELIDEGVIK